MSKPSATAPRSRQPSSAAISTSLRKSLESTRDGLQQFLVSLEKSGFRDAVSGYRELQAVLVQQRLWAHAHGRKEQVPLFSEIGEIAASLHSIFSGYADIMRPLMQLGSLAPAESMFAESPPSESK